SARLLLLLDIDRFVTEQRIDDRRQVQRYRVCTRKPRVADGGPLHRRSSAISISEKRVVAHPDLVSVVDDGGARQRKQERVHQLDTPPVAVPQWGKAAANPEIDPQAAR